MVKRYKESRKELEKYDKNLGLGEPARNAFSIADAGGEGLSKKEEIIILTKSDVIEDNPSISLRTIDLINRKKKEFEKISKKFLCCLYMTTSQLKTFRDELVKILKKKV